MNISNIRLGFANNSSSTHSFIFLPEQSVQDYDVEGNEFGWQNFTAASDESKLAYLALAFQSNLAHHIGEDYSWMVVKELMGVEAGGYIDHQSTPTLPLKYEKLYYRPEIDMEFVEEFKQFLLQPGLVILGGNDNSESEHPLSNDTAFSPPFIDEGWGSVCRKDARGHWTLFNRDTGAKIRFRFDNKEVGLSSTPELVDLRLTNRCDQGCAYCYQGSTSTAPHGDRGDIMDIIKQLHEMKVLEVACLDKDTWVFGPEGAIRIGDLRIGDYLFDSTGVSKQIVKITKQNKECIEVKGSKGWTQICTADHPFIINNEIVPASKLLGRNLDLLQTTTPLPTNNYTESIDLGELITSPTNLGVRGGSVGGKIKGDKVRLSHSSKWINKTIQLTSDLLWLYGLVVAEGSKRGVALHKKEKRIADKSVRIYKKLTGFNSNIRKNGENGIAVDFDQSFVYRKIFFGAFQIGEGARNKSIKFLFNLPTPLIQSALQGMWEVDGCFRKKKTKKYYDFSASYKTSSEKLAQEICFLLYSKFNVFSSIHRGENKKRKIGKRVLEPSPYYQIEIYGKYNLDKVFPEVFKHDKDYQIIGTSIYSGNKNHNFVKVSKIKKAGVREVVDITLDDTSTHIFPLQFGVLTHNCGGGEPTKHPDFLEVIEQIHHCGMVPNFTTKDISWLRDPDFVSDVFEYAGSFAVSVDCAEDVKRLYSLLTQTGRWKHNSQGLSVSIQLVMGTVSKPAFEEIIKVAAMFRFRITLLGFKTTGRGQDYKEDNWLYKDYSWWLKSIQALRTSSYYTSIGVDTILAKEFESEIKAAGISHRLYETQEGMHSCYIDAVELKMGPSSYCDESLMVPITTQVPKTNWNKSGLKLLDASELGQKFREIQSLSRG